MGLFFYTKKGSIISTVDLPTTEIIEPKYRDMHHNVKWNEKIWSEGDKANSSSEAM